MNYEDFKARIYSMVREEFDSDTEVTLKPVRKNNGVVLDGITIMPEGSCIAPTIYINQYYERYREGLSLEAIVRIILEENRHYSFDYPLDVDEFLKYDRLKERIRFRLVNYSMNEELLSDVPYVKFLDLAKIYYYEIRDRRFPSAFCTIRHSDLLRWEITGEELDKIADANMQRFEPPRIYTMREMVDILANGSQNAREVPDPVVPMYILTSESRCFGASTMLYDHVFGEFEGLIREDLFVLPSSVHEVIVTPASGGFSGFELERMVTEINKECVPDYEVLSNRVYFYDREKDELRLF